MKDPSWVQTVKSQRSAGRSQEEIETLTFSVALRNIGRGAQAEVPIAFYGAVMETIRKGELSNGWKVQVQLFEVLFTVPKSVAEGGDAASRKEFREMFTSPSILEKLNHIMMALRRTVTKQKKIASSSASE